MQPEPLFVASLVVFFVSFKNGTLLLLVGSPYFVNLDFNMWNDRNFLN